MPPLSSFQPPQWIFLFAASTAANKDPPSGQNIYGEKCTEPPHDTWRKHELRHLEGLTPPSATQQATPLTTEQVNKTRVKGESKLQKYLESKKEN